MGKLLLHNNCSQSIVLEFACTFIMMELSTSVIIQCHAWRRKIRIFTNSITIVSRIMSKVTRILKKKTSFLVCMCFIFFRMTLIRNVHAFLLNVWSVTFQVWPKVLLLCKVCFLSFFFCNTNLLTHSRVFVIILPNQMYHNLYFIPKIPYINCHCV